MKNTKNIKSNTKRIIALALALLMIVTAFTACGNKEKPAVNPDVSNTSSSTTEGVELVPSIDSDEETATTVAGKDDKDNQTATNAAGDKNDKTPAGKPESKPTSTGKPAQKPVTTTKPSGGSSSSDKKPTTTRPAPKPESTSKPSSGKPESTTQPSTPSGNTYAYFRASTGERIKYLTYRGDLDQARCTGISESNGKITATYDIGASEEWWKCDNCGKYLCEGCQPVLHEKCPYCGKRTCERQGNDGECYYCGQFVKGKTCHDCPKSPRR